MATERIKVRGCFVELKNGEGTLRGVSILVKNGEVIVKFEGKRGYAYLNADTGTSVRSAFNSLARRIRTADRDLAREVRKARKELKRQVRYAKDAAQTARNFKKALAGD